MEAVYGGDRMNMEQRKNSFKRLASALKDLGIVRVVYSPSAKSYQFTETIDIEA